MFRSKWMILSAFVLMVSSVQAVQAVQVEQYDVNVPQKFLVRYHGDNPAFKGGLPTGFGSALTLKSVNPDGSVEFYGITDRGANGDSPKRELNGKIYDSKFFLVPDFQPQIGLIKLQNGKVQVIKVTGLKNADGSKITGLPMTPGRTGATGEIPLGEKGNVLPYDDNGLDTEGIALDHKNNTFWISDEYGPFVMEFSHDGTLMKKYGPGTGLPDIFKYRTPNRGFEGLCLTPNGHILIEEQSILPLKHDSLSAKKTASFTRLILFNPDTVTSKTYAYPINTYYKKPGDAKIGDVAAINDHEFLIIEQGKDKNKTEHNFIYKIDISGADDISGRKIDGLEPEFYDHAGNIQMVKKELLLDLRQYGWTAEKAEGITILPDKKTIAVINDNDFGVKTQVIDKNNPHTKADKYILDAQGRYTLAGQPSSPKIKLVPSDAEEQATVLFLIHLDEPLK